MKKCPKCGKIYNDSLTECPAFFCAYKKLEKMPDDVQNAQSINEKDVLLETKKSPNKDKEQYPALGAIIAIARFFGWATFILTCIIGLVLAQHALLMSIVFIFTGLITLLICLASAETLKVVIDIEANTRKIANK